MRNGIEERLNQGWSWDDLSGHASEVETMSPPAMCILAEKIEEDELEGFTEEGLFDDIDEDEYRDSDSDWDEEDEYYRGRRIRPLPDDWDEDDDW